MIYIKLFLSFFQIGIFSIGGGYAAIPLIQNQLVEINKWLTMNEFVDIITIAEMTPGPIAINSATFAGIKVAGFLGAVFATVGFIFPSLIIVLILAYFYYKYRELKLIKGILLGLRPAVTALIASAGILILLLAFFGESSLPLNFKELNYVSVLIFLAAIYLLKRFKVNPIYIILGSGAAGVLIYGLI